MALATNTLVDGQWTTRNLDVNSVLRHHEQQDQEATRRRADLQRAPVLGLLTQTAIRSPLVHWILPVKLRSQHANDVAFIGVSRLFPYVCPLRLKPVSVSSSLCYIPKSVSCTGKLVIPSAAVHINKT